MQSKEPDNLTTIALGRISKDEVVRRKANKTLPLNFSIRYKNKKG